MTAAAKLIAKLEAAPRGTMDLTADVYEHLGYRVIRTPAPPYTGVAWRYLKNSRWLAMERLTESIDDALRLRPNHWAWHLRWNCTSDGDEVHANARAWHFADPRALLATGVWAIHREPAMALAMVLIKAREAAALLP